MSETVAAVVVSYNRKQLLCECLEALLAQTRSLDKIIIIDNASSDGTPELLKKNGYLSKDLVEYVRLNTNTGGAGGFHEGMKRAFEAGYNWIWVMDDDAEPNCDALNIASHHFENKKLAAVASLKIGWNDEPQLQHCGWFNFCRGTKGIIRPVPQCKLNAPICVDFSSFVGLAIRSEAVGKIGYPKKEFFIHCDDSEYCLRLIKEGQILLEPKSLVSHKDWQDKRTHTSKKFIRNSNRIMLPNLWITYYGVRNSTWLIKSHCRLPFLSIILKAVRLFTGIFLYDNNKLLRVKFYFLAIIDGWTGNFDNLKSLNILENK